MTPSKAGSSWCTGVLIWALLAAVGPCLAQSSADTAFDVGVALAREGRFAEALAQFHAAEAAGDRSARLYFNLGVVNYRLGHFGPAREAFERAAQSPETADLANFNRGLVALASGDRAEAAHWFEQVGKDARDLSLRQLAQVALQRARGAGMPVPSASRGSVSLLRGWDSNVIVPVGTITEAPTSRRDEYLEGRALWSDALGDSVEGLGYRLSGVFIEYDTVHDGDVAAAEAAIEWNGPFLVEAAISALSVDDKGYQRTLDVRLQVPLVETRGVRLDLDGGWSRFDPLDGRAADLEGSRYAYGASLSTGVRWFRAGLAYRHLKNDRFASALSPEQDRVQVRMRIDVGRVSWRAWGRYTDSDYPNARRDEATDWGMDLAYRLHHRVEMLVEGSRLENLSTAPELDYVTERILAGLRVSF